MANNTTAQDVLKKYSNQVVAGVVTAQGATLQDRVETKGTFVANGASQVTVVEPRITANSIVVVTLKTVGGTVSPTVPNVITITPGTGFNIAGVAADTSTYNYMVID